MTPKKCVFVTVTAILCAILFIAGIIPMLKYYDYDKATCLVTQIDYPQVLPNVNHTDNWDECRCGRSCKTLSPCINLYVSGDVTFVFMNFIFPSLIFMVA